MTEPTFDTWIRPASLLSWNDETDGHGTSNARVAIGAPNGYIRDWLESRLTIPIQRALAAVAEHPVELQFQVCDQVRVQAIDVVQSGVETTCPGSAS
jgi:chromosomal replication initiation ATPase DnaA